MIFTEKNEKTLNYKLQELDVALEAINDALSNFSINYKKSYMLTISSQSRSLVVPCYGKDALLIKLIKTLNFNYFFYSMPGKSILDKNFRTDLLKELYPDKTWFLNYIPGLVFYDINTWLDIPYFFISINNIKEFKTRRYMLKQIANKHGGAHYDNSISPIFESLECYKVGNEENKELYNGVDIFLTDIATAIYYIGKSLINYVEAQRTNINYSSYIPQIELEKKYINFRISKVSMPPLSLFGYIASENDKGEQNN